MAETFNNTASLMAALQREMHSAMAEISLQGLMKAHENATEFYEQGNPSFYKRTGTYGTAPNTDGVQGFGNKQEVEIYMEEAGHGYSTGTFSAHEVWEAAEDHTSGVLGMPGRWAQTESDVEEIINNVCSEHFNKG